MIWLGNRRGHLTDWITQRWVCLTGRRTISPECDWLLGPSGSVQGIGGEFFLQLAKTTNSRVVVNAPNSGLLEDFGLLRSNSFESDQVHPEIIRFYESTSCFVLDVRCEWIGAFKPFGSMLRVIFSRRLQQLNVPISPLDTSRGISSEIITLLDSNSGKRNETGWLRRMLVSGDVIYAALYSIAEPPLLKQPCMKVVFPLPNGHATVLMKPEVGERGSLKFHSEGSSFGDAGFYFVVRDKADQAWARYVRTLKETIHIYMSQSGELRADHVLKIWGFVFLRFHYRITARTVASTSINQISESRST